MITSKMLLLSVSVIAILVSGTILIAIPATPRTFAQQNVAGADRVFPNQDQQATGFSPQTQITKDNIQFLELRWIRPTPPGSPLPGFGANFRGQTSMATPLIKDGIIYTRTEDLMVTALDATTGKTIWSYQAPPAVVNLTIALTELPIELGLASHSHMFSYFEGRIYAPWPNCQILGLNALNGNLEFKLKTPTCANIQGNLGKYKGLQSVGPVFDSKTRTLIYGTAGSEATSGGRGAIRGYNLDTGDLKWTFYLMPAQGQSDSEWTLRVADKGWIQGIKASSLPREVLLNDWHYQGVVGKPGAQLSAAGVNIGWGQWSVDETTGIVYIGTAQPAPDWNATYRPGPNVFSDSVIALKTGTGELQWWHQVYAHDLWDYDCSWNTALATINSRKMVFKECKGAHMYAFDAATGESLWWTNYEPDQKRTATGPQPNYEDRLDPRKVSDMQRPWLNYPNVKPFWTNLPGSESDVAVAYGKVYSTTIHSWAYMQIVSAEPTIRGSSGRTSVAGPFQPEVNSTVWAHDAATGKVIWKYYIKNGGVRGGVTVSAGLVYVTSSDGFVRALDAEKGNVVWEKFLGGISPLQPVFGADSSGKVKMFVLIGSVGLLGGLLGAGAAVPGGLLAYGLPDKLPEPQVITKEVPKEVVKEVVKEVPKEVVKEVIKEVPKEVIKEVVKEVPKEVIKEVPREVTKTVTVETISPISYAAIGVSIVVLVIAGVLFSRRKKV